MTVNLCYIMRTVKYPLTLDRGHTVFTSIPAPFHFSRLHCHIIGNVLWLGLTNEPGYWRWVDGTTLRKANPSWSNFVHKSNSCVTINSRRQLRYYRSSSCDKTNEFYCQKIPGKHGSYEMTCEKKCDST